MSEHGQGRRSAYEVGLPSLLLKGPGHTSKKTHIATEEDNSVSKAYHLQYQLIHSLSEQFFFEDSEDLPKFVSYLENGSHLSRRDISKNNKGFYGLFQLLENQGKLHLGKYSLLNKFGEITNKVEIGRYIYKYEELIKKEIGPDAIILKKPGNDISDNLQELIEATRQIQIDEGTVFIQSPAFKKCQEKLDIFGHVTIIGDCGDGRKTIAMELLKLSERQSVIIEEHESCEKIDLTTDDNLIVLFHDMLDKFVLKQLQEIFDCVRNNKIQVVITCREIIFSECTQELKKIQLFGPERCVHMSGRASDCSLDIVTRRNMIYKYINSKYAMPLISTCDSLDSEILSPPPGGECKISSDTLEKIAQITCPGFPKCCFMFVSTPEYLARGDTFFDQPTEFIDIDLNRMHTSSDDKDKRYLCAMGCVLIFDKLTTDIIEGESETIEQVAKACRINITPSSLKQAVENLSTSYLVYSRDTGEFTFQHNSVLQTVFTWFFKSIPKLLIERCRYKLIANLITTQNSKRKPVLFCEIQDAMQTEWLCARLATEIMAHNVENVTSHRVLSDSKFANKFCYYIEKSHQKQNILQSVDFYYQLADCHERDVKACILLLSVENSDECFVEHLLPVMKSTFSETTMIKELSTMLLEACYRGKYAMYELLVSQPGVIVSDGCLLSATDNKKSQIVKALLSVRDWNKDQLSNALHRACWKSTYKVFKTLLKCGCFDVHYKCLKLVAERGHVEMLIDLLNVRKWSTEEVTEALKTACNLNGNYDVFRELIKYDEKAVDGELLYRAAFCKNCRIMNDLRSKGHELPYLGI